MFNRIGFGVVCEVEASSEEIAEAESPPGRERVRVANIEAVRREKIREIRADVVYAIARRSPGSVG